MYENLMEEAVTPENHGKALRAVLRNDGAPGIDGMRTAELKKHLETHWEKIRAKLLAGTYVPTIGDRIILNQGKETLGMIRREPCGRVRATAATI
jgi:hypothetical protein